MEKDDWICPRCKQMCDVYQEESVDRVPYGDQMVNMRTLSWPISMCCGVEVEELKCSEVIH